MSKILVPIHLKIVFKMPVLFFRSNRSLYSLVSLRPLPADYEPSMVTRPSTCPVQGNLQVKEYLIFSLALYFK